MDQRKSDSVTYTNEVCVIGAILISYSSAGFEAMRTRIFALLKPEMFYEKTARYLYEIILSCFMEAIEPDLVIVHSKLKALGRIDEIGGVEAIMKIIDDTPNCANGEVYAKEVHLLWRRRYVGRALDELRHQVSDPATKMTGEGMLDIIHRAVKALTEAGDKEAVLYLESLIEGALNMPVGESGAIVTRIGKIDGNINLFAPGELTILAARPSIGKSTLMRQICRNAATAGDMLLFSMEATPQTVTLQFACELAGVPYYDYSRNKITDDQRTAVIMQMENETLKRIAVYNRGSVTTMDVMMTITQMNVKGRKIACVFIDYLGLMKHEKADRHDLSIGATTRALKQIAMDTNVPIILLSQLNREVEKRGNTESCDRPRLADLRDSGNIEQDADNVLFLWRKERGDEYKTVEPRTLTVAKHRNGQCFETDLMFDKERATFYEIRPNGTMITAPPNPEWTSK